MLLLARVLLKKAHHIIKTLNDLLVLPIIKTSPALSGALNPYSIFSYPSYQYDINEIVDPEIFKGLINAFANSAPVRNILNTPDSLRNQISSENYLTSSLMFIDKIGKYGVHDAPQDFHELKQNIKVRSAETFVVNIIFSVICLRKIISIIDQIIFQAFLTDKLPILNENNIIKILKQNSHMVGDGLTLLIQAVGSEIFSPPGDLMLVKLQANNHNIDKLCLVERASLNFSRDFGNTAEFGLRALDEQLNPYFNLLK